MHDVDKTSFHSFWRHCQQLRLLHNAYGHINQIQYPFTSITDFILVDQIVLPVSSSFITVWVDSKLDKYVIQLPVVSKTHITEFSTKMHFNNVNIISTQ